MKAELDHENARFHLTVDEVQLAATREVDGARSLTDAGYLYGQRDFPVPQATVLVASLGIDPKSDDAAAVRLSAPIQILDANGKASYVGYNFDAGARGTGYGLIATHTRVALVGPQKFNAFLDPGATYYLLVDGGSIVTSDKIATGIAGVEVLAPGRLSAVLDANRSQMLELDRADLNATEVESEIALNNLAGIVAADPKTLVSSTTYNGQTDYGYGGIVTPTDYLASRYGGTWTQSATRGLMMPSFTMDWIDDLSPSTNHCVLTAITRTFAHARAKGYTAINSPDQQLFIRVKNVGLTQGYSASSGVAWNRIEPMIESVGDYFGYTNTQLSWIGVFSWSGTVKSSIADVYPLIFAIQGGYYTNHAVTVSGLREFTSNTGRVSHMLVVWDGWVNSTRYLDYDAFTSDGLGSVGAFFPVQVR